ncbi:TonB-dependent receptor [Chitinophaga silvatica]|uniref:TonB-dependent receptor n=1 Tax=Chitinophaga silvatica TaxID=2282649 RepID=A0A3E1YBB4_9BACT|nr:TonB-dependent receptor [Chitinophaga silvatica]RFS23279.1 TonB-dependent receptor [Chitinophaga silvatica]
MLRFFSMVGMLLILSIFSFAQVGQLTGKVTDAKDGTPLPGVTVKVKNSNIGTITDATGTYHLSVPSSAVFLTFSFVGFADHEIAIAGHSTINIALQSGNKDLSEVIVVGYGTLTKKDVTGSISKVASKEVENQPVASLESAIQGKVPGVVIESGSGKVGQGIKVRVRGTSSISASSQPLYVIDGMPVNTTSRSDIYNDETNPMADINPNDIESIEVLKDASAAAIYGARGANGVILITTKKGKAGEKTKLELNANNTWGRPTKKRGFLNAQDYIDLLHERAVNDGKLSFAAGYNPVNPALPPFASEAEAIDYMTKRVDNALKSFSLGKDLKSLGYTTDWESLMFRDPAHSQQIDLSATGGNEKTKFYVSGFYINQQSIVKNNDFKRYGGRLNLEHNASDRVSLGMNVNISRSQLDRVSNDNSFSTPGQLVAQSPVSPYLDDNGEINNSTLYPNGLYDAQFNTSSMITFRTLGNVFLNYKILPSLSFRSELGADISTINEDSYIGVLASDAFGKGFGSSFISQDVALNTNNYFSFNPQLGGDHTLSATAGMSYLQDDFNSTQVQGELFPSDIIKKLAAAASITFGSTQAQRYTFLSYFARANYSYKNKYIASISVRSDGSSRFGPNNRYGIFPAGSVAWVLSEEEFLKSNPTLTYLKVRASYGSTGNAEIGENRFLTLLSPTSYPQLPGYRPTQMGNPDLKWERTNQVDVGIEFGLFDNRFSGEIDYYNKQTSDLLLKANLPYTSGYGFQYMNIGSMENKGVEIMLNSINIRNRNFKWTTTLNLAYNKNRVKNIGGQIIESTGGEQRAVEGEPIGVFYMPKFAGVDPKTGEALYVDGSGKNTTSYSDAVKMVVGKSNPDWTGGFTNTFSSHGFDLSVFFSFVQGNNIYNRAGIYQDNGFASGYDNQRVDVLNRWQKPNDITNVPRLSRYFSNGANQMSSRWISDGSYIRLKSATLGYNLPKQALDVLKISGLRLYVAGYNLWTKTKFVGDPEVNSDVMGNIAGGIDYYTIPQAKQVTVGVNVKF